LKELSNYSIHRPQEPQGQARWNISLSRFNFIIMYRLGSQHDVPDALSKRSYLASKEGDTKYDQQHSVLLKPKRLLFKTLHTTTSVDPAFLKDICISLLSDPLALQFKQSCVAFGPQNGQIEVPNFQTPNSEILNPEFLDSLNSNSWINRSHEGDRPQDDIDPRFQFMDGLLY
jgi:hypothetical protein